MTTTTLTPAQTGTPHPRGRRKSGLRIVASFAALDYRRTVRMFESTFFIVVLPAALYLMFGALSSWGDDAIGHGNVAAYNMTSMTVYGATVATSSIAAGASGFVVKDTPAAELADAVRAVHAGRRVVDPTLAEETLISGSNPLTDRERDVLRAALDGSSVRQIAAALFLSPGTVRNHLSSAIGKTHTSNRTEAALTARENGWL